MIVKIKFPIPVRQTNDDEVTIEVDTTMRPVLNEYAIKLFQEHGIPENEYEVFHDNIARQVTLKCLLSQVKIV